MSSCSFGTLASFARLPMSEVVVRSRIKFGGILITSTGTEEAGDGGVMIIDDLNSESDIVSDNGRRAKDGIG